MPHRLLPRPLVQSSAFRYDSPAMEPADYLPTLNMTSETWEATEERTDY